MHMKASGSCKIQVENLDTRVFQAFLNENDKNRMLTLHNSQCMTTKILMKDFMIMRLTISKQFNKHKYLNRSNGLLLSPFYNALQGTDIIELRLEGP